MYHMTPRRVDEINVDLVLQHQVEAAVVVSLPLGQGDHLEHRGSQPLHALGHHKGIADAAGQHKYMNVKMDSRRTETSPPYFAIPLKNLKNPKQWPNCSLLYLKQILCPTARLWFQLQGLWVPDSWVHYFKKYYSTVQVD
eukprot:TRINITY_DN1108_c0_g1_i18.p1 TRINITY_DN1108_c0_g1~~TRINITY_DN1108_c0_g1_i18.p1  ORF type:complete len:140 (-),score=4.03 TRINITY_DN1108_c0_g1_i18:909-1328(-)